METRGCCSKHNGKQLSREEALRPLPQDFVKRAEQVASASASYLLDVIAEIYSSFAAHRDDHGNEYEAKRVDARASYHVLCNNDDVHTYQEVTDALRSEPVSLTTELARERTEEVDRLGRASVYEAAAWDDERLVDIATTLRGPGCRLLISVCRNEQQTREIKALVVISILNEMSALSPGLAHIVGDALFAAESDRFGRMAARTDGWLSRGNEIMARWWPSADDVARSPTSVECWIKYDALLPVKIRDQMHKLYITLFACTAFKENFARAFARVYRHMTLIYIVGIGTYASTVHHLSVQMYTTPSIVSLLNHEQNLLEDLVQNFTIITDVIFGQGPDFDDRGPLAFRRYGLLFNDIRYVLRTNSNVKSVYEGGLMYEFLDALVGI